MYRVVIFECKNSPNISLDAIRFAKATSPDLQIDLSADSDDNDDDDDDEDNSSYVDSGSEERWGILFYGWCLC